MTSFEEKTDYLIIGGGMVGLSIAYRIKEIIPYSKIIVIEKENDLGKHSSGRNSGVLHAGIYYKPKSLKAKVCIKGAKRLIKFCEDQELKILKCGKIISPQKIELDNQIDFLFKRGIANGTEVKIINKKEFKDRVPHGRTSSGRALWSPNTTIVNPKLILKRLREILESKGVIFLFNKTINHIDIENNRLYLLKDFTLKYKFFINSAGIQADKIAHKFGVGLNLKIMPFKGLYWALSPSCPLKFNTNLYPVPDLNLPFLGVHVTPDLEGNINLGPTAIPAFGRENYKVLENLEPIMSLNFFLELANQWVNNKGGFRKYSTEQLFQGLKPFFYKSAKLLIPELKSEHLVPSKKVGIRAQLFDKNKKELLNDFKVEHGKDSIHILNAISPAFTASFELADLILEKIKLSYYF